MSLEQSRVEWPRVVRRIAFTCDFLRLRPTATGYDSVQLRNMGWLHEVMRLPLHSAARELELSTVVPPQGAAAFARAMGSRAALREYGSDAELAWARRYDAGELDMFRPVLDQLLHADLVIGFELPPSLKRSLHRAGRCYLSLHVHALRYLRDLCLGATTNSLWLTRCLECCAVPDQEVARQAARFKARFALHHPRALAFPPEMPILVGQTARDSILIARGDFFDWPQARDALAELTRAHPGVVLLEHPYRGDSASIAEHLRAVHGKQVISTNANGYGVLLANGKAPFLATLASSLGVEAASMGLPAHFLLGDPRDRLIASGIDAGTRLPLGHAVLTEAFWSAVFAGPAAGGPSVADPFRPFALGDDYLRQSLDAWAYRFLLGDINLATCRKSLYPAAPLPAGALGSLARRLVDLPADVSWDGSDPVTELQSHGVVLVVADAPLDAGETRRIPFDAPAATAHLAQGFHAPEPWGCWSRGQRAQLCFSVRPEVVAAGCRLRLALSMHPYSGLLPACPVLRIRSAGCVLAYVVFRPRTAETASLEIQVPVSDPVCRVDIEISDSASPASQGDTHDQRLLGFALTRMEVSCERGVADRRQGPAAWGIGPEALQLARLVPASGVRPS